MSALYPITKRTNSIFFNAILGTLESAGCTNIAHNGRVIRCTYEGKGKRLIYSPAPLPGHVTTCVHALQHLGLIKPTPIKPAQNIINMSEQSYNKAKAKRGTKKRHAA